MIVPTVQEKSDGPASPHMSICEWAIRLALPIQKKLASRSGDALQLKLLGDEEAWVVDEAGGMGRSPVGFYLDVTRPGVG